MAPGEIDATLFGSGNYLYCAFNCLFHYLLTLTYPSVQSEFAFELLARSGYALVPPDHALEAIHDVYLRNKSCLPKDRARVNLKVRLPCSGFLVAYSMSYVDGYQHSGIYTPDSHNIPSSLPSASCHERYNQAPLSIPHAPDLQAAYGSSCPCRHKGEQPAELVCSGA